MSRLYRQTSSNDEPDCFRFVNCDNQVVNEYYYDESTSKLISRPVNQEREDDCSPEPSTSYRPDPRRIPDYQPSRPLYSTKSNSSFSDNNDETDSSTSDPSPYHYPEDREYKKNPYVSSLYTQMPNPFQPANNDSVKYNPFQPTNNDSVKYNPFQPTNNDSVKYNPFSASSQVNPNQSTLSNPFAFPPPPPPPPPYPFPTPVVDNHSESSEKETSSKPEIAQSSSSIPPNSNTQNESVLTQSPIPPPFIPKQQVPPIAPQIQKPAMVASPYSSSYQPSLPQPSSLQSSNYTSYSLPPPPPMTSSYIPPPPMATTSYPPPPPMTSSYIPPPPVAQVQSLPVATTVPSTSFSSAPATSLPQPTYYNYSSLSSSQRVPSCAYDIHASSASSTTSSLPFPTYKAQSSPHYYSGTSTSLNDYRKSINPIQESNTSPQITVLNTINQTTNQNTPDSSSYSNKPSTMTHTMHYSQPTSYKYNVEQKVQHYSDSDSDDEKRPSIKPSKNYTQHHNLFAPIQFTVQSNANESVSESDDSDEELIECSICYCSFIPEALYTVPCQQKHKFCYNCMYSEFKARLAEKSNMICPLCEDDPFIFTPSDIKEILQHFNQNPKEIEDLVATYEKHYDTKIILCPKCGHELILTTEEVSKHIPIYCNNCCMNICSTCRKPYHYNLSCQDVSSIEYEWIQWCTTGREKRFEVRKQYDQSLEQYNIDKEKAEKEYDSKVARFKELVESEQEMLKNSDNYRYCPNCRRLITRIEGCNSMVCGRDYHNTNAAIHGCGTRFDWSTAPKYQAKLPKKPTYEFNRELPSMENQIKHNKKFECTFCKLFGKPDSTITGIRFACINCNKFYLCEDCEYKYRDDHFDGNHIFRILLDPNEP